jgi:uncharacterized Zn-finger protein
VVKLKYEVQPTVILRDPIIQARVPSLPSNSLLTQLHTAIVSGNPAALPSVPIAQQPLARPSVNPQYPSRHFASDAHHAAGVYVNPGIPAHFQNYRPIEHGQPVVPSQSHAHFVTPQDPYPNPATWTQDTHSHYSNLATSSSSPTMSGYPAPLPSAPSLPHICDVCGATFTRPQNLKRHRESQHTTMEHICPYCGKSYTRVDSLKRHMDKPCDKLPRSAQQGA